MVRRKELEKILKKLKSRLMRAKIMLVKWKNCLIRLFRKNLKLIKMHHWDNLMKLKSMSKKDKLSVKKQMPNMKFTTLSKHWTKFLQKKILIHGPKNLMMPDLRKSMLWLKDKELIKWLMILDLLMLITA